MLDFTPRPSNIDPTQCKGRTWETSFVSEMSFGPRSVIAEGDAMDHRDARNAFRQQNLGFDPMRSPVGPHSFNLSPALPSKFLLTATALELTLATGGWDRYKPESILNDIATQFPPKTVLGGFPDISTGSPGK